MTNRYNHRIIEKKHLKSVQKISEFDLSPINDNESCANSANDNIKGKFYCLEMFPYPSGKIHMGHVRNYTLGDVLARYKKACGYHVIHPMGWDAFGLPAENAAKERNISAADWTFDNIINMRQQLHRLGLMITNNQEIATCHEGYYGQQQKIFLDFYKHNIAYKKESYVNWDPIDQTVLANEQVIDGKGWRSGALVERKKLNQWFLKISDFADDLLKGLDTLDEWPQKVKTMQEKWIGKSEGADIHLKIIDDTNNIIDSVTVFTTRHETIFGMAYIAIAYNHSIVEKIVTKSTDLKTFIQNCEQENAVTDRDVVFDKKGFQLNLWAENPINNQRVPVFVANYVLADYGSGAVFGCPAHDERDFEFAQHYDLPIKQVITQNIDCPTDTILPYTQKSGFLINSGQFSDLSITDARQQIVEFLHNKQAGQAKITYRLRDWGVSRQRYWGCPIPIIYCDTCGIVPVPQHDLPVILPKDIDFSVQGNPLDHHPTWKYVVCPKCQCDAVRETDTLDTFFDSSWYFMRYLSPRHDDYIDAEKVNNLMPVDQYIGGIEHAVLHLLYARFMTRALQKIGKIDIYEPFKSLFTQGMVCHATYKSNDGRWLEPTEVMMQDAIYLEKTTHQPVTKGASIKMSKSKKNIIDPEDIFSRYGADTARWFVLTDTPPDKDIEWTDSGIEAAYKFMSRIWTILSDISAQTDSHKQDFSQQDNKIRLLLKEYSHNLSLMIYNKALAKIYELFNFIQAETKQGFILSQSLKSEILVCLYPVIPFITTELWEIIGMAGTISDQKWPDYSHIKEEISEITIAVQILGKMRGTITVSADASQTDIEETVQNTPIFDKYINGKTIKKVIYVAGKIINYVVV